MAGILRSNSMMPVTQNASLLGPLSLSVRDMHTHVCSHVSDMHAVSGTGGNTALLVSSPGDSSKCPNVAFTVPVISTNKNTGL